MNKNFLSLVAKALILCICLLPLSACAPQQVESAPQQAESAPEQLASAKYPTRLAYPSYNELEVEYLDAYNAWQDEQQNRRSIQFHTPYDFFTRSTKEVLCSESKNNIAYSPLNLYMALTLLAETTDGESRAQILELLGAKDMESLRTEAEQIRQANHRDDGYVSTVFSNALFLNDAVPYQKATLENAAKYHYADIFRGTMGTAEYDTQIQKWLSEKTKGMLEENVNAVKSEPETAMMLLSTLYFQSKWEKSFSENRNTQDVFHGKKGKKTVEFMNKEGRMPYYQGDNFTAVCNEFSEGGSMWLILPGENVDVMEVAASEGLLEPVFYPPQQQMIDPYSSEIIEDENMPYVTLSMPKFDFTCSNDLNGALKKLGVTDVFDAETADFSALTGKKGDALLSKARHDVRVTVDEEGCSAVAFTKMEVDLSADSPFTMNRVDFILDRPFIFVVASDTNVPLFTGIVQNP